MTAIEVFRTNVTSRRRAQALRRQLQAHFPGGRITFDLADCDRVLRVQTPDEAIDPNLVTRLLHTAGYHCEVLPD